MKPKSKMIVIGGYSRRGYTLYKAVGKSYATVYSAGNSPHDSATYLDPSDPWAMSLREIRSACLRTAKDLAEELHAEFGGVERALDHDGECF